MPENEANPAGYWERLDVWRANEFVLKRLEGSWFDPPTAEAQIVAREWAVPTLRTVVDQIIEDADGAPVALKDPRIGVMLGVWEPIVRGTLHPVLVMRDPIEIAHSLHRRDGTPPALALAAWELHMTALLDYLHEQTVTVAPYAGLVQDGRLGPRIVQQAAAHIDPKRAARVHPEAAVEAYDAELWRNRATHVDHDEQLTTHQLALWRFLVSLPAGAQLLDIPVALRRPSDAARVGVRCETNRAQLANNLAAERARAGEFEATLSAGREQNASLTARLAAEQERAAGLAEALAAELLRVSTLTGELASERERAEHATAAHLRAEGWLAVVQSSVSWRITTPLRRANRALRRTGEDTNGAGDRYAWLGAQRALATASTAPRPTTRRRLPVRRTFPTGAALCEIHVPISPTPSFVTKVRYLAASLRLNGGALSDCPVIVTVGADQPTDLAAEHPWAERLGVQWRWLDDSRWRRYGIFATALERFCHEPASRYSLLLDADTLFVRPVDDLLAAIERRPAIAGVIAHVSPFFDIPAGQGLWERIFHAAGLGNPVYVCEHSGWGVMEDDPAKRHCPPYFNLGVLLAHRDVLRKLAGSIYAEMETVERVHPTVFRCQLALTMAIVRSGVRWRELPLRFNLPNIADYLPLHQSELDDARILHYLKDDEQQLTRSDDLASVESVAALLERDGLHPINARLQQALREVHGYVLAEA